MIALFAAASFIFIRSIYRLIELQGGFDSDLALNEDLFIIFEGPMIILAAGLLLYPHPGRAFEGRENSPTLIGRKPEKSSGCIENK
jgi:RTA1 like protein